MAALRDNTDTKYLRRCYKDKQNILKPPTALESGETVERTTERITERTIERITERIIKRTIERIIGRITERTI